MPEGPPTIKVYIIYEGKISQDNIIKVVHTGPEDRDEYLRALKVQNPNGDFRTAEVVIDVSNITGVKT